MPSLDTMWAEMEATLPARGPDARKLIYFVRSLRDDLVEGRALLDFVEKFEAQEIDIERSQLGLRAELRARFDAHFGQMDDDHRNAAWTRDRAEWLDPTPDFEVALGALENAVLGTGLGLDRETIFARAHYNARIRLLRALCSSSTNPSASSTGGT